MSDPFAFRHPVPRKKCVGPLWAALGAACVLIVAACGTSVSSAKQPLTFAVIAPLSGVNSLYGTNLKDGVQLAVNEINRSGGVDGRKITIAYYDTQCTAAGAATAATDIASSTPRPFVVIGDVCSGATLAAIPILYRAGIAEISGDSSSPLITTVVAEHHYTNFARTIPSDGQQAVDMVEYAHYILHANRVAILYSNSDYGQPMFAAESPEIAKLGMSLVASAYYTEATTTNFLPQWTRLEAAKPDVVLLDGDYSELGTAVSQMDRVSFPRVPLILSAGAADNGYTSVGGSRAVGSLVFSYYAPNNPVPGNATFVRKYVAAYHTQPNEQSAHGYGIVQIVVDAIEKYGASAKTLIAVIKEHTFQTDTGEVGFTKYGDVTHQAGIIEIGTSSGLAIDVSATKRMAALLSK